MAIASLKFLSLSDVDDMLDANEWSERFISLQEIDISDARNRPMTLIEEHLVSGRDIVIGAVKYMSTQDVHDMLEANELLDECESKFAPR